MLLSEKKCCWDERKCLQYNITVKKVSIRFCTAFRDKPISKSSPTQLKIYEKRTIFLKRKFKFLKETINFIVFKAYK